MGRNVLIVISGPYEPGLLIPLQMPVSPILPPDPDAEVYGRMIWDLPLSMAYKPYQEVGAILEAWNPSDTNRLYAIGYYFINPQGAVVTQDYLLFTTNGVQFASFILHAGAPEPMVTIIAFRAPSGGYKFGLRMLELEMVDATVLIKHETNRLEVLLGVSQNGSESIMPAITGLLAIALVGVSVKALTEGGIS